jgi:hypothetical protein
MMQLAARMNGLITSCYNDAHRVTPDGSAAQLVVPANNKRLFLAVYSLAGAATCGLLLPDADVLVTVVAGKMPSGTTWKFHDAPTLTSGEWYGHGTDADGWVWYEECYNGD